MKKALIIAFAAILLIGIVAAAYVFFRKSTTPATPTNPFGFTSTTTSPSGGTSSTDSLPLVLSDGTTAAVPDFTKTDQPAWAGPTSGYRVAGTETSEFLITYILPESATSMGEFLVTILAEPLGANRLAAEQSLRSTLGLSDAQLCKLDTYVAPGPGVSETYSGTEVGLSFCPGSVKLP